MRAAAPNQKSLMIRTISGNIAFLLLFSIRTFAGQSADTGKKVISTPMDISDYKGRLNDLQTFIDSNFFTVEYEGFENPMHPFKVGFINRTDSLKFCTMTVLQCWVQRIDTFYSFFMILKRSAAVKRHITSVYGNCDVSALVTAEGINMSDSLFMWRRGHLRIDEQPYYNISGIPKFEDCDLIIFGNMKFEQLLLDTLK